MASGSRPTRPRRAVDEVTAVAEPTPVASVGPPQSPPPTSAPLPSPSLSPDGSTGGVRGDAGSVPVLGAADGSPYVVAAAQTVAGRALDNLETLTLSESLKDATMAFLNMCPEGELPHWNDWQRVVHKLRDYFDEDLPAGFAERQGFFSALYNTTMAQIGVSRDLRWVAYVLTKPL